MNASRDTVRSELRQPLFPVTSAEHVNTIAHFYRGELGRMASWRDRLDRTTNWAVAGAAAMLSISLSAPSSHHGVVLLAMLLVLLLLGIEARRYRFFDVYRRRVRMMERHYYATIFDPDAGEDAREWRRKLASDLREPVFSVSMGEALARRLMRNYAWIFLILLIAWVIKLMLTVVTYVSGWVSFDAALRTALENARLGPVPGMAIIAGVALFYIGMLLLIVRYRRRRGEYGEKKVTV